MLHSTSITFDNMKWINEMTKFRYRNLRRRLRNVFNKLSSSQSEGRNDKINCMRYHKIVRNKHSKNNMSVGCFGNCSFDSERSTDNLNSSQEPRRMTKMHCTFYPPIQTVLREKDTEKWWVFDDEHVGLI